MTDYCFIGGELLLACWLMSGIASRASALVTVALLSSFSGILVVELQKKRPKPCGCLATISEYDEAAIRRQLIHGVSRNVMLAGIAGGLFYCVPPAAVPSDVRSRSLSALNGSVFR